MEEYLKTITDKKNLTSKEAEQLLDLMIEVGADPILTSAVLSALSVKGETVDEIVGFINGMRKKMVKVDGGNETLDIVGTGGDGSNSFNISTTTALVVAGAGVAVAKHGNRAASSKCGSADVLEALGVNINLDLAKAEQVLKNSGMVFMFAPNFHPAMKTVGPIRKALKIRTIFNFLGPFLNPAGVKRMLLGAPNLEFAKTLLEVAKKLDYKHLTIVTSFDGMDEVSIANKTTAFGLKNGKVRKFIIDPSKLGFKKYAKSDLVGGDPGFNAQIIKDILNGTDNGAKKDAVILNSAFALLIAGKVKSIKEGIPLAEDSINSGKALQVLEKLIEETNK